MCSKVVKYETSVASSKKWLSILDTALPTLEELPEGFPPLGRCGHMVPSSLNLQ